MRRELGGDRFWWPSMGRIGGMALGSHFWLTWGGLVEISLYGVAEFYEVETLVVSSTIPAPHASPGMKGAASIPNGAATLGSSLSQPAASTPAVSKSQLGYFWRVKEKFAKQLSKNKELLAETLVVSPGEGVKGYSKEVHSVMGMTWGGDDIKLLDLLSTRERKAKGIRELKNLDCPMSPVKSQRGRGVLGLKMIIPFPLKFIRVVLMGVGAGSVLGVILYILLGAFNGSLIVRV